MSLFCKRCLYDLQGQQSPRCPECGTAFAFDDPRTFLPVRGRAASLMHRIRGRRRDVLIGLTFLLSFCYGIAISELPHLANASAPMRLAGDNLKNVMTAWLVQINARPQPADFDVDVAKKVISPGFSPYSEADAARRKATVIYLLRHGPMFVVPTMVFLLLVAIIEVKRPRRIAIALLLMFSLILFASASPYESARWIFPGSYGFLDDIVTIPGVNLYAGGRGYTIAAYDVKSFRGEGRRGIAFADGHVEWLTDEKARPLFEAQGLDYPVQGDSGPASE